MKRITIAILTIFLAACGDTDVANRGGELEPGQEVEDMGLERDVEAVQLDTVAWFTEGRTVTFEGRPWIVVGEPVFDPAVEYVGEFEGTPLYAEVGTTAHGELYIPVGDDYWQRLEQGSSSVPAGEMSDDTAGGA